MIQELSTMDETAEKREVLFFHLYTEAFPLLARYVSNHGGSFEEAKDVFQDALVIYYEKRSLGSLDIHTTDKSYLLGIAKHLYLKRYSSGLRFDSITEGMADLPDIGEPEPATTRLLRFLETAGKKCMDLLQAFYYDKKPLSEIANSFGYSGVRSATVQKYKCIEKVRERIKEKSLGYEDFLD